MRSLLVVILLSLLLPACAWFRPPPNVYDGDPSSLERFEIRGRVGLRGGGSANLNWRQDGSNYRIVLTGPFGTGRVDIEGDGDFVTWEDDNGRRISTDGAEDLLRRQLGWYLPVNALRYWVRGLPSPDRPIGQFRMESGQLQALEQDGWQLQIDRYHDLGEGTLPGRLILQQDQTRITLLISEWVLL